MFTTAILNIVSPKFALKRNFAMCLIEFTDALLSDCIVPIDNHKMKGGEYGSPPYR